MSADSRSASFCPFFTRVPWPAYRCTILPSLPGPMTATRSSGTRIFPVAGVIPATGKILVPEDRVAVIGPGNEGRIVHLYAGQGTRVKKGQKLADLESADIDQAEADYLKALADYENARRSSAAEIKLAQENYDRAKLLYQQKITAGKNLQSAEHDLEVAKASAENSINGTNAALIAARRHLLI